MIETPPVLGLVKTAGIRDPGIANTSRNCLIEEMPQIR